MFEGGYYCSSQSIKNSFHVRVLVVEGNPFGTGCFSSPFVLLCSAPLLPGHILSEFLPPLPSSCALGQGGSWAGTPHPGLSGVRCREGGGEEGSQGSVAP